MRFYVLIFSLFLFAPIISVTAQDSLSIISDKELSAIYQAGDLDKMEEIAELGNPKAQTWLGLMLQNRAQHAEALKWYSRAGEQGDAFAINSAAFLHERGLGTSKNLQAALEWYRKGAEYGHASHQSQYAFALLDGDVVERDEAQALVWFLKAAEQKELLSNLGLAILYAEGHEIERDPKKAYAYARIFESRESSDTINIRRAKNIQKEMKKLMSKEDVKYAEKLFEELRK